MFALGKCGVCGCVSVCALMQSFRKSDGQSYNQHEGIDTTVSYAINKIRRKHSIRLALARRDLFRLVHVPPDMAHQIRESVEEAFQSLGGATAELLLHYARERHHVSMSKLPEGIEDLDKSLKEVLGAGRRIVVNNCAEILSRKLGKDIIAKTDKLSDIFKQVLTVYRKKPKTREQEIPSLLGDPEGLSESLLGDTDLQ